MRRVEIHTTTGTVTLRAFWIGTPQPPSARFRQPSSEVQRARWKAFSRRQWAKRASRQSLVKQTPIRRLQKEGRGGRVKVSAFPKSMVHRRDWWRGAVFITFGRPSILHTLPGHQYSFGQLKETDPRRQIQQAENHLYPFCL